MCDQFFYAETENVCGGNQLLGCEFVSGHIYITGGNSEGEPNKVYILNPDGIYYDEFDQWSSPGWGWRDLACDDLYLYGSDDYIIDAFDPDDNPAPYMNINGLIGPCRALAYDPVWNHFWAQSFSGPLYEFNRMGNVLW